jgi:hypothetical protein|tara:strand:+ start:52 stop:321 length:270 start_codon:yes stop_codon:yes gene_type:complete
MDLNSTEDSTRVQGTIRIDYTDDGVFINCNEIRRLANEIDLFDIVDPSSNIEGKLMEIVSRAKCLSEFEILPDGERWFGESSREKARRE